MSATDSLHRQRRLRIIEIAILILGVADAILNAGSFMVILPVIIVALMAWSLRVNVRTVRLIRQTHRPRPDYASIARMEREVYGETFEHEGAPRTATLTIGAGGVSMAEAALGMRHLSLIMSGGQQATCPQGHGDQAWVEGRGRFCPECDRRRRGGYRSNLRWDGQTTHPDTTGPATRDQYVAWLEGYIKRGGKPTHFYDYPFSRAGFRYASSRLTIDSGYEFGARSRMIVVASGVETQRTNPAGPFGGWAHAKLYFMHGYRTNDSIVPVYSDPEFDFARRYGD